MSKVREKIFEVIEKHVDELNKNECSITLLEIADAVAIAISSGEIPGVGVCEGCAEVSKLEGLETELHYARQEIGYLRERSKVDEFRR